MLKSEMLVLQFFSHLQTICWPVFAEIVFAEIAYVMVDIRDKVFKCFISGIRKVKIPSKN